MFCHELILGFWSDQSETYMYVIYMGLKLCPTPLGASSYRPFFCERGRNIASHSILMTYVIILSKISVKNLSKQISQSHVKITSRSRQGHVKAALR